MVSDEMPGFISFSLTYRAWYFLEPEPVSINLLIKNKQFVYFIYIAAALI